MRFNDISDVAYFSFGQPAYYFVIGWLIQGGTKIDCKYVVFNRGKAYQ